MLGLSPKLLVGEKDNYNDIIFQQIHMVNYPYEKFLLSGHIAIGFRQLLLNNKYVELVLYQGMDLTPFVSKGWGFYEDLHTGRNRRLGIKIKYYFSSFKR